MAPQPLTALEPSPLEAEGWQPNALGLWRLSWEPRTRTPLPGQSCAARHGLALFLSEASSAATPTAATPTHLACGKAWPHLACGEAWPLPGWSQETVEELAAVLETLGPSARPLQAWWQQARAPGLPPSLAWALSAACWRVHHPPRATTRHSAWLCRGSLAEVIQELERRLREAETAPFSAPLPLAPTAKVKVSEWSVAQVGELCDWVSRRAPQLRLRLDANQSWTPDAVRAVAHLPAHRVVAYWEEPSVTPALLGLAREGIPIALDESLRQPRPSPALLTSASAWVIKPTLTGSLAHWLRWHDQARLLGKALVLSSCFEGAATLSLFMELADPEISHGFDPYFDHVADGPLRREGSWCYHAGQPAHPIVDRVR